MTQVIPSALEIRCALARANVLETIHGEKSEIVQDTMCDVRDLALFLGGHDFVCGLSETPPLFDGTWLATLWASGFAEARDSYEYSRACAYEEFGELE